MLLLSSKRIELKIVHFEISERITWNIFLFLSRKIKYHLIFSLIIFYIFAKKISNWKISYGQWFCNFGILENNFKWFISPQIFLNIFINRPPLFSQRRYQVQKFHTSNSLPISEYWRITWNHGIFLNKYFYYRYVSSRRTSWKNSVQSFSNFRTGFIALLHNIFKKHFYRYLEGEGGRIIQKKKNFSSSIQTRIHN